MAGKINYLAPVDNASGKIFGKKQRFVAVTRKKGDRIRGCAVTSPRSTTPSASELAHRQKFGAVATATQARLINPQQAPLDKAAYVAQKDKYNSLYQYVFRQEWVAYNKPQDVG